MAFSLSSENPSAILLDIEGTTTPIAFVYDELFPFARARVRDYLEHHCGEPDVTEALARLRREHQEDEALDLRPPALTDKSKGDRLDSLVAYVYWLMDRDRKSTGLKALQGCIWWRGYLDGELRSKVFSDVPRAFARWREAGYRISIFSSGSKLAQELLFRYTESGDLTRFIDSYFDTTIGPKSAPKSYQLIAAALGLEPAAILFISDTVTELEAARRARMRTWLCVRPGNHPQPSDHEHHVITSF